MPLCLALSLHLAWLQGGYSFGSFKIKLKNSKLVDVWATRRGSYSTAHSISIIPPNRNHGRCTVGALCERSLSSSNRYKDPIIKVMRLHDRLFSSEFTDVDSSHGQNHHLNNIRCTDQSRLERRMPKKTLLRINSYVVQILELQMWCRMKQNLLGTTHLCLPDPPSISTFFTQGIIWTNGKSQAIHKTSTATCQPKLSPSKTLARCPEFSRSRELTQHF